MKTLKGHLGIAALSLVILTSGCANHSNPQKVAFQAAAEQHYENVAAIIQSTKRAVSGGSRGVSSQSYYPTSNYQNWNGGVYQPSNGTYMQSNVNAEIQTCQADLNAIPKQYAKQRLVLLYQCLQVALQYRNSYYTRMYANTTDYTQNMWQYSSFYQFPGQYPQYNQYNYAYQWLNQYLYAGYVPQNVTYGSNGQSCNYGCNQGY